MGQQVSSRRPSILRVVSLPDTFPPQSIRTTTSSLELIPKPRPCDLPEDIIHEIRPYLTSTERLNLSVLSRSYHPAFPPRPTDVTCNSLSTVASLSRHLAGKPEDAMYLVRLEVKSSGWHNSKKASHHLSSILSAAQNLRHLACSPTVLQSAQARCAILEVLPHLSHLTISEPWQGALCALVYPRSLVSLHFVSLQDSWTTWHDLARILSGLPNLVELWLEDATFGIADDEQDYDEESRSAIPPIAHPRLRRLVASSSNPGLANSYIPTTPSCLARQFPNLNTLVLEDTYLPSPVGFGPREIEPKECSPTLTSFAVRGEAFTPALWTTHVVELKIASQLRWFQFESTREDFRSTIASLDDVFSERALHEAKRLPLMFLCVTARQTRKPDESDVGDQKLCTRLMEDAVVALPNLRYLALARVPNGAVGSAREPARWQWWRIIRDTGPVEVREIPTWEGERVRKYMYDADMARANAFDGELFISIYT